MVVDIFILAYLRQNFTRQTIKYLKERTKCPHRLILIDNGGNEEFNDQVDVYLNPGRNIGVHGGWNLALENAESELFVTTDNDIWVPDLDPDWLNQLVEIMRKNPEFAAISLHPHVFIGAAEIPLDIPEDVVERNMCGAVARLMNAEAVRQAGGWEDTTEPGRNHEESYICSRLQGLGYKVGITPRLRAYHPFGDNWGYPESFTPEMQKHNPALKDYVKNFDRIENYDERTWFPK